MLASASSSAGPNTAKELSSDEASLAGMGEMWRCKIDKSLLPVSLEMA